MNEPHTIEQVCDAPGRKERCEYGSYEDIDLVYRRTEKHGQGQRPDFFYTRMRRFELGPQGHFLFA